MAAKAHEINVRGQTEVINPNLLFQRIVVVMTDPDDIKEFLTYELCEHPASIFHHCLLRRTAKSGSQRKWQHDRGWRSPEP